LDNRTSGAKKCVRVARLGASGHAGSTLLCGASTGSASIAEIGRDEA
jgi:hypothetical protein